jgi:uncharacterized membrane protein (UPF0182 family)
MTIPFDRGYGRRVNAPFPPAVRRVVIALAAAFFLVFVVIPWLVSFATDWLWFRQLGFTTVYATSLTWRVVLFLVGGLVSYAVLAGNLRLAARRAGKTPALYREGASRELVNVSAAVLRVSWIAPLVIALFVGIYMASNWMTYVQAGHAATVGTTDPLFGRDIGFYMFRLPAVSDALGIMLLLVVLSLLGAGVVYVLRGQVPIAAHHGPAERGAEIHLATLAAVFFLIVAVQLWVVDSANLLYSTTGPLVGASYTDVHVSLPGIRASAIAALVAIGLVIYGAVRGRLLRRLAIAVIVYAAVGIVGRALLPLTVQKLSVLPNELDKETPYLQAHIAATRAAWGLDKVQTRSLSGEATLTMADIKGNRPTINNVRLWERDLLQQTFKQLQEIRTYYDFLSVNDDRYMIDGDYRQVHLSVRELNSASLPTQTFINNRLTFTHGMGITMAPVNQVTDEGLPVLFIKDLPPVSTVNVKLTQPQIYFGQEPEQYVFVNTKQKEFDYPLGDQNIYTSYPGTGGVPVGSFLRRALYAMQFGSLQILFSDDIAASARIMYHRNIVDRASMALPFLSFDAEPYIVVTDDGKLKWVLDGYTTSGGYPYSKSVDGVDYMRNSVKVTIDAYTGAVTAYVVDANDPVIRTYERIFAGIFQPMSAMPADIKRHMRYPSQLFRIQATLQGTYHMDDPVAFYHREDEWQIPTEQDPQSNVTPYMRHMIMRLPGEQKEEFIYMTPFTPRGKDNLAAWMVARMDGDHYGQLMVYRFPKQSLVYGPKQIVNRINQDTDISRQITLWDQRGSEVIRGELLVIPIEESLIYVQPLFLRASGGSIPEMKRVIVASGDRVVMGETLDQALDAMFGSGATLAVSGQQQQPVADTATAPALGAAAPAPPAGEPALVAQAQAHYDRAIAAQRAGDWATYGKEIDSLGAVLTRLRGRHP